MIRRLFGIALIIVITGAIASFLNAQQGNAVIEWMGWRLEVRTSLLVAMAFGAMVFVIGFDRFVGMIIGLPDRISGRMAQRRQEQGHHALAIGLIAASAGDAREAERQAKKATRLMGSSTLTDLLTAQAAGLNGDDRAAVAFFEKLEENRETAFFGKAGLMRLKAKEGHADDALVLGREALQLNQNTPELAKALLALEAREGHWDGAITALNVAARDKAMPRDDVKHLEAVLFLNKAQDEVHQGAPSGQILKSLETSLKADPGFTPAALAAINIYRDAQKPRKIIPTLEKSFAACPHPDIVKALFNEWSGDDDQNTDALAKLIRLIDKHGNDHTCLLAAGRLAMQLSLWGEALRLVTLIPEDDRNITAWQMMADLADHAPDDSNDDWPDRAKSLIKAAEAKPPQAWACKSCQTRHQSWNAICSSCDGFATTRWL